MKNKLISLLGLVSKKEYDELEKFYNNLRVKQKRELSKVSGESDRVSEYAKHIQENNESLVKSLNQAKSELSKVNDYVKHVLEKNVEMSGNLMELTTKIKDLKDEINALNNLRASDQQDLKKLSVDPEKEARKRYIYTCDIPEKKTFRTLRDIAIYLNCPIRSISDMLEGKLINDNKIKRIELKDELDSILPNGVTYEVDGKFFRTLQAVANHIGIARGHVCLILKGGSPNTYKIKRHER